MSSSSFRTTYCRAHSLSKSTEPGGWFSSLSSRLVLFLISKSFNHKLCVACSLSSSSPSLSSSSSSSSLSSSPSSTYCEITAQHSVSKHWMMRQIVWGSWNTSNFNQLEFCCRCISGCFKNSPTSDDPNFTAQKANNKMCDSFLGLQNNRWNIRQLFSRSWGRES